LGSCHYGKYPWEVATWEKSFGKLSKSTVTPWVSHYRFLDDAGRFLKFHGQRRANNLNIKS